MVYDSTLRRGDQLQHLRQAAVPDVHAPPADDQPDERLRPRLVAGRHADRVHQPAIRQLRHLRDERGRHGHPAADDRTGLRRLPVVVARRHAARLREQPRGRQLRHLDHQRERADEPAAGDERPGGGRVAVLVARRAGGSPSTRSATATGRSTSSGAAARSRRSRRTRSPTSSRRGRRTGGSSCSCTTPAGARRSTRAGCRPASRRPLAGGPAYQPVVLAGRPLGAVRVAAARARSWRRWPRPTVPARPC